MLRINLLPAYIAERKKTRLAIILASLLFLGITGLGLGYHFGVLTPQVEEAKRLADEEQVKADRVTQLIAAIEAEKQKIKPIEDKVNFVENVWFHNTVRSKVFRNAARFTDPKVEFSGMAANGNTLSINAYARSLDDLGRFYIGMFGNPDVSAVSISGIPGWPRNRADQSNFQGYNPLGNQAQTAASEWWPVQMVATLVRPIVTPQLPATLTGGGQGGFGMPGGMGGPGMMGPMGGGPMDGGAMGDMPGGGPPPDAGPGAAM
jgi:hypothetical protein